MSTSKATHRIFSFGNFTLDLDRGALLRAGEEVRLRPKSFHVLRHLVERHGTLVPKAELMDVVWGQTAVTDDALTQCLIDIRRALDDSDKTTIRTVPKRGFVFDAPVSYSGAGERAGKDFRPVAQMAAVIVVLAIVLWIWNDDRELHPARPEAAILSLAVLPFADMSALQDQQYLGDGIAEDLLTALARIRQLRVISRTSAFSKRGGDIDIPTIATQLGATHILEGSVRKDGETIRVSVQLIEAQTDSHLWSASYDREFEDVFTLQDEIVAEVASQLQLALFESPLEVEPVDTRAYELVLHARYLLDQYNPDHWPKIKRLLQQALEINPDYVLALTELARLYVHEWEEGVRAEGDAETHYHEVIHRAYQVGPDSGVVHIFLGYEPLLFDNDVKSGAAYIERAVRLDPTNLFVLKWAQNYATYIFRFETAKVLGDYVIARDPLCLRCRMNLAIAYEWAGEFDAAAKQYESMAELDPTSWMLPRYRAGMAKLLSGDASAAISEFGREKNAVWKSAGLSLAYHDTNRMEEFETEFETLRQLEGNDRAVAAVYAWIGDSETALDLLEKTVFGNPRGSADVYQELVYRNLHDHPRWIKLLSESGLSPDVLASIDFDPPLPQ